MIYLWPGAGLNGTDTPDYFGIMARPSDESVALGIKAGRRWACDNEAFTRGFEPDRFFLFLDKLKPWRDTCLFIVCPDVVGDAWQTLWLYSEWADRCRQFGPVAFVAQDGQEGIEFPFIFDWLFIGGTTEWKMSPAADSCIQRAKRMGKPVHVGRVNSIKRILHFAQMGVDSVDGTFPCFEPDAAKKRLPKGLLQPALFRRVVPDSDCGG